MALMATLAGCVAAPAASTARATHPISPADTTALEDRALSWRVPLAAAEIRGARLLYDTPLSSGPKLAVVRSIVRSNHRLDPFDALVFATAAVGIARAHHLDYGFFCGTLLQESAFDPDARSNAGAVGIAQFTLETAADYGIDPFAWRDAMEGAASLLGRYVNAYDGLYANPYAVALAAYNAGPGTVAYYKGVPPYPETRAYIDDIDDRWSRIVRDAGRMRRPRV
jgi:soluble lytic murein transglycosylase-like protein